jgi:hypothetical protein
MAGSLADPGADGPAGQPRTRAGRSPVNRHEYGEFTKSRARIELNEQALRESAARTVAGQARDAEDLYGLLAMLGLDRHDSQATLRAGLAGYVQAVAEAMRVPVEATDFEISDTVTAYLALAVHWVLRPGRDLMLLWNETHGWSVAVETIPGESPVVLGYLGGTDVVPAPRAVAQFVAGLVNGPRNPAGRPAFPVDSDRKELTRRLSHYATKPG